MNKEITLSKLNPKGNKMSDLFKMLIMMGAALSASVAQASDPVCSTGSSLAYIEGEINNNIVAFHPDITLGVAEIQVFKKKGPSIKLTCALNGIPSTVGPHNYDHRIVCDDDAQSELSFDTTFTGAAPLNPKLERKLCRGTHVAYFQENSLPDTVEARKGIFSGVVGGNVSVNGCVNEGSDPYPDVQINMVIDGYLCLQNQPH